MFVVPTTEARSIYDVELPRLSGKPAKLSEYAGQVVPPQFWPEDLDYAGKRVVVIGSINDVAPYRELVRRGVSDYVIAPVNTIDVVRSICGLFSAPEAKA